MCIYCTTTNYRKIYEHHYGPIPKDEYGRKHEIHHIDGNRKNNDPANLKCVSLQEHYDIHYSQGDWMACHKIAGKLKLSGEEISELARRHARQQLANGTHPFQKEGQQSAKAKKSISEGTHNFLGDRNPVYGRIAAGTHNFLGGEISRRVNKVRVANGTHNFLGGDVAREAANRRIANGTHHFVGPNAPSQQEWHCPICNRKGKGKGTYTRWHGDNCRHK
jgi:hypothetical protein